ncbi:MAG: 23S rRNA (uracil(1939)-C(5))-methyltransferase RlmD [Lactimicrobium sp.]|jgi:23S rRNA (uracil1939-C5)-methyltransferase|uniref:23S rRNA (uracil(1939)-C(5))-methyltransferase RlmD n=1 Tax=Lactimicrobium sp. TaxID=2563780 RepID=UPI002F351756
MIKRCKVDKKCGACRYLAVPYSQQLIQKRNKVRELFPGVNVEPVKGMQDPYHYRCKVYCAFGYDERGHVKAGLFQEHSHKIVYTDACLIQNTKANAIIHDLCNTADQLQIEPYDEDRGTGVLRYGYLRVSHASGDVLLTIVIGSHFLPKEKAFLSIILKKHPEIKTVILNYNHGTDSMVLGPNEKVIYGNGSITDTIDGLTFSISSKSFFQVNPVMTTVLYQTALDLAELKKNETVLDACCGIGTISLLAARQASFVIGVEINPQAIRDAKKNAKINHISNVEFVAMDAEEFMNHLGERPDVVFLDPVRAGLSEKFLHALGSLQPDRIIYVSCNPETQARDTKILRKYGYRIRTMVPVDQFPFAPNTENVALLVRKNNR